MNICNFNKLWSRKGWVFSVLTVSVMLLVGQSVGISGWLLVSLPPERHLLPQL